MDKDAIRAVLALVEGEINATDCVSQWECGQDAYEDGMREGMIHIRDMIEQELLEGSVSH